MTIQGRQQAFARGDQASTCCATLQVNNLQNETFTAPSGNRGAKLTTARGEVVHHIGPPGSRSLLAKVHLVEVLLAPVEGLEYISREGRIGPFHAPAGAVLTTIANTPASMRWASVKESIILALKPSRLRKPDATGLQLHASPLAADSAALEIAWQLKAACAKPEKTDAAGADALITQLIMHLLQDGAEEDSWRKSRTELSRYNARKVQTFMRQNLARKLTVADLAGICGLSSSHFISAFTETFGQAPYSYLLHLRLAYAERLLAECDLSTAEIAYLSGFSSQSHLTTAMKKTKGITPSTIRNRK